MQNQRCLIVPRVSLLKNDIIIENVEYPDGITLDESYLSEKNIRTSPPNGLKNTKITLSERNYYILGDNRRASSDSRTFGPIHIQNIVGKTEAIIYPINMLRGIEEPEYDL